jgi:t-SNARE syntaxin family protein
VTTIDPQATLELSLTRWPTRTRATPSWKSRSKSPPIRCLALPPNTSPRDVQSTLTSTRHLFSSYLRIRATASPTSPELQSSRTDLHTNLTTLSTDLADLLDSIAAVESDPYRFGLDVAEVERRRTFVKDVGGEVEGMRRELESVTAETTHVADGGRLPAPSSFDEEGEGGGDAYGEFEQQAQQQMMHEQDEQLDGVFQTVGVLRNQAEDMGRELEEQGTMLDEVDTLADRVGGKLNVGVKRVGEVIRKNEDTVSSCCIGVLILVLVLLLILVIVL